MLRVLLFVFLAVLLAYAVLTGIVYFLQDKMLFYPARHVARSPAHAGLVFETVALQTSDEEQLHGWWIPATEPRGTVVVCHGNAGNIGDRLDLAELFHRLRLNVLLFDYRGYGQSTGTPDEAGLYRDAEAAWRMTLRKGGGDPLHTFVFGESIGAGPATWLAQQNRVGALILEAPFTSVPDAAALHFPWLPARRLTRTQFDNLSRIAHIEAPLLILHSLDDEIIPFAQGKQLFDAARLPKAFAELDGGHNTARFVSREAYAQAIDDFLRQQIVW